MKANCAIVSVTNDRGLNPLIPFRLSMILPLVAIFCLGVMEVAVAQTNLAVPARGEFTLDKDSLLIDELILGDSAIVVLTKPASKLKARRMVIGKGVRIIGTGENGINGKNGRNAAPSKGVCKPGGNGEAGKPGTTGTDGMDFILEVDQLTLESQLSINLNGGNGGDGGKGGDASQGSNSVSNCISNGGNGGNGGSGGAGGRGGKVTLIIQSQTAAELTKLINLSNRGGYRGVGGKGGYPGPRGNGASKESKHGLLGKYGVDGITGAQGRSLFYSIIKGNALAGQSVRSGIANN